MAKTSKKKSYTEDVVLNKILKDISEENLEDSNSSSQEDSKQNTYEDDLIKLYRKKDASQRRHTYINIVKIITLLSILIFLIFIFTNYIDTITEEPTQVKKAVTPTPVPKIVKPSKPVQNETIIIESKDIIPLKIEPKKTTPTPVEKPVKVKTERELAKEMLLKQMNN